MMFLGQGGFFDRTYYFVFVLPNCLIYFHVLALTCVCFVFVCPACTFIWTWRIWNLPFGLPLLLNGLYLLFSLSLSLSISFLPSLLISSLLYYLHVLFFTLISNYL